MKEVLPLDQAGPLTAALRQRYAKGRLYQVIGDAKGISRVKRPKLTPAKVGQQLPCFHPSPHVRPFGIQCHHGPPA